ncbi:MAG: DUF3823 domain-containing protein [Bacteroidales bacterium]|nr:DUF3823 domain-containing protein [Bacteroidales bacterium]
MRISYIIGLLVLLLTACEYDNFDAPESKFTGSITYNGTPLGFASGDVFFRLWEIGDWPTPAPIEVLVAQDGSFSALLFDAEYKLIIPADGQNPFISNTNPETSSDTIIVKISGSKKMDIEVLPYYIINNVSYTTSGAQVSATCSVSKINTGATARDIANVTLLIGDTQFVSNSRNIGKASVTGAGITDMGNIPLKVTINKPKVNQTEFYARIGVQISGVTDLVYSPVTKVTVQF